MPQLVPTGGCVNLRNLLEEIASLAVAARRHTANVALHPATAALCNLSGHHTWAAAPARWEHLPERGGPPGSDSGGLEHAAPGAAAGGAPLSEDNLKRHQQGLAADAGGADGGAAGAAAGRASALPDSRSRSPSPADGPDGGRKWRSRSQRKLAAPVTAEDLLNALQGVSLALSASKRRTSREPVEDDPPDPRCGGARGMEGVLHVRILACASAVLALLARSFGCWHR